VYLPHGAADVLSEVDAVQNGSRTEDDVGVDHPIAVTIECAVVHYYCWISNDGVRSR